MDIILELKNIKHSFTRDNEVLKDTSLQVNRGEIITILGPSGCGKTTLLRIIAGLEEQSAGTVSIDNELVSGHLNHVNTEKRNIGLVVQERALFPHLSIVNNVKFGIKGTNKNNTERALVLRDMQKTIPMKYQVVNNKGLHWQELWRQIQKFC